MVLSVFVCAVVSFFKENENNNTDLIYSQNNKELFLIMPAFWNFSKCNQYI